MPRLALAALWLFAAAGCATTVHGEIESIQVNSDPTGAKLRVDADPVSYTAPSHFDLVRNHDHTMVASKDGYEDQTIKLSHHVSPAIAGNVLFGIIIGPLAIADDFISGSAYSLSNADLKGDVLTIHLIPKANAAAVTQSGLTSATSAEAAAPTSVTSATASPSADRHATAVAAPSDERRALNGAQSQTAKPSAIAKTGEPTAAPIAK